MVGANIQGSLSLHRLSRVQYQAQCGHNTVERLKQEIGLPTALGPRPP